MAKQPLLVCATCGGSGIVPDETRVECRSIKDKALREDLEGHLRMRGEIFESVDTMLALDRMGYLDEGHAISTAILNVQCMTTSAAHHLQTGDKAEALFCLLVAAAECVWCMEGHEFPLKPDVFAQHKRMKGEVDDNGEE